jgi:hypothetical protein
MHIEAPRADSRIEQLKEKARRAALSFKISLAAGLLVATMPLGAETNPAHQKNIRQRSVAEKNVREKKVTIVAPSELRTMVLTDDRERVFMASKESPDAYIEVMLSDTTGGQATLSPEAEKLLENSQKITKIHTHPLGIYNIAGYSPDQISAAREGLIPVPLSLPPSIPDLLSAKMFSEIENNGRGSVDADQKIYGTDGVWSFEGGKNSILFTEIGEVRKELVEIFSSFREGLPKKLQERYDTIIGFAENSGDARQGIICRDINELAKDPELATKISPLEQKLNKLTIDHAQTFRVMEEINMLSIDMTHPEKRGAAMRRYFEITEKEGFKITFEPDEKAKQEQ